MPSGRAALSWGFGLSLALHAAWLGSAPQAHPYVKRAAPAHMLELAIVRLPSRTLAPAETQQAAAADPGRADAPAVTTLVPDALASQPMAAGTADARPKAAAARDSARRAPRLRARAIEPETASVAPPLPAADDVGRDLSVLERTLKRIAATTELSPDQRRKAMLVVLRTWEDPSRNEGAAQLIETLLHELHPGEDR